MRCLRVPPRSVALGEMMDITLITEGTYPHHMGGVSVWCDQLVRAVPESHFNLLALTATGTEKVIWEMPANVEAVGTVPLWGPGPPRRPSPGLRKMFEPMLEDFLKSLMVQNQGNGFVQSLQELGDLALGGQLGAAMSSRESVDLLLALNPVCSERPGGGDPGPLSVADAVDVLMLLEHFLRPLGTRLGRTDLCHSVSNGLGALPALAAKWERGTPFLLTEHGLYLRERYLSYKPGTLSQPARAIVLRFFRLLVETAYESADIVAPGSGYNRLWELANGTPPHRIRPVHNGVDPASFPVAAGEPDVPTLVWVGRVDPLKDVETLLRAFAQVRESIPDCRLRMFGPTPEGGESYRRRCGELLTELGLEGAAVFEGRVGSVVDAYHAGHVVVLTSISEGLPYTVLEAMAAGRPVVATDVGGVAEAVGDAGAMATPRDPASIAAACVQLLGNESERRALGEAARKRVMKLFTAERCFDLYRKLYKELGSRQPRVLRLSGDDNAEPWYRGQHYSRSGAPA